MGNYCAGNIARRSAVPKLGGGAATAIALAGLANIEGNSFKFLCFEPMLEEIIVCIYLLREINFTNAQFNYL